MIKQFFLVGTASLMIAGFLLIWDSPPESFIRSTDKSLDTPPVADSYMRDIHTQAFTTEGIEQFSIKSPQIDVFSDLSKIVLTETLFQARTQGSDNLQISANNASFDRQLKEVYWTGDVELSISSETRTTLLKTSALVYSIEKGIIQGEEPFRLEHPQSQINGDSLRVDLNHGLYQFTGRIRAVYHLL